MNRYFADAHGTEMSDARGMQDEMQALADIELCERAKCELRGAGKQWSWRHGMRSSADQYGKIFDSKAEAAAHFVQSRECIEWCRRNLST
jgi:hypothetical protein